MSKCWGHGLHIFFLGGDPPSQKKVQKIIFSPEHAKLKKIVLRIFFLFFGGGGVPPPPPKKKNVQNMTPTFAHYQSSKPLSLKIGQKNFGFCLGWGPSRFFVLFSVTEP